ncbi:MAG: hypothetical protein NVS9B15_01190 [Acidobacteriaceae bacterium]
MDKSAFLYQASQVVLSTFDLDEVLRHILCTVRDHFAVANGAIFLIDHTTQELYIRQHVGRLADSITVVPLGKGITGHAAAGKQPIYVADVSQDPRYIEGFCDTRSELAIPLVVRDEVVGLLDLQSNEPDAFDSETVQLLSLFSTQASIGIENARLYSLEKLRSTQLEAINAIARQTTAQLDLDELLPAVSTLVLKHFGVSHIAVLLHKGSQLQIRSEFGVLRPRSVVISATDNASLVPLTFQTQSLILENDLSHAHEAGPFYQGSAAEVCFPLTFHGDRLGVLAIGSAESNFFSPAVLDPLTAIADIIASAIKNCLQLESARQLAYRDGLTGIFNRRFFEERIVEELDRSSRYQSGLTLLMVDIDHFKSVNDDFGHLLGDEVLKQVSQLFMQQLRKSDIVCRFGGEEFAILLPQSHPQRSVEVAEKLRRIIHACPFPGVTRPVTVSIGVAHSPNNGTYRDQLIGGADAALYTAKQNGRNRVVLAPAEHLAVSEPTSN